MRFAPFGGAVASALMPEMSNFQMPTHLRMPHLNLICIHPKDLTVLPYFHFGNYNYEM